jgi:hypothetical protein
MTGNLEVLRARGRVGRPNFRVADNTPNSAAILCSGRTVLRGRTWANSVIAFFAPALALCFAQTTRQNAIPTLLPHALRVSGQVVGEDGKPIPNVRFSHLRPFREVVTDSNGEFDLETASPAFVAQQPGFQSTYVKTRELTGLRVVLRKSPRGLLFPVCSNAAMAGRAPGWGGALQVSRAQVIRAGREITDVDYTARSVRVRSAFGKLSVIQGRGLMWGGDGPDDLSVWRSVRYEEITYDLNGRIVTDARGWLADGTCWRSVGTFGESLSYRDVECGRTRPLDDLIDGACAAPDAANRLLP